MSKRKKQAPAGRPAAPSDDGAPDPTAVEAAPQGDGYKDAPEITEVSPPAVFPDEEQNAREELADGEGAAAGSADGPADEDAEPTQEVATIDETTAGEGVAVMEMTIGAASDYDESADGWEEPTRVGEADELAELAAQTAVEPDGDVVTAEGEALAIDSETRLESIIESLLFAADRPLNLADLKRLVSERDAKKLIAALSALQVRHQQMGIQLASAGGGWQFRTNPDNASWVAKLIAGRPARLSRAMLETLAIVAYRQPITRPEIDDIRGVDCGPVLKTLLDRVLIRMIGKKEEVGRPILYGTTPEFLRTFSLKDLTELPTLRQFHELGVAEQAKVDAESPAVARATPGEAPAAPGPQRAMPAATNLPEHDPDEEDALLAQLDDATASATRASRSPDPPPHAVTDAAEDAPSPPRHG